MKMYFRKEKGQLHSLSPEILLGMNIPTDETLIYIGDVKSRSGLRERQQLNSASRLLTSDWWYPLNMRPLWTGCCTAQLVPTAQQCLDRNSSSRAQKRWTGHGDAGCRFNSRTSPALQSLVTVWGRDTPIVTAPTPTGCRNRVPI